MLENTTTQQTFWFDFPPQETDGEGPEPVLVPLPALRRRLDLHGHLLSRRIARPLHPGQVNFAPPFLIEKNLNSF